MEEEGLLANAAKVGAHLKSALSRELAAELKSGAVKEIRGLGLMLGIDLAKPCGELLKRAADKGLLLSVTADSVIRLVPPLIITQAEVEEIVTILCPLIKQLLAEKP
jgi:acetylornithine/N-succinyldiaminopimelate aminotransferase